jgi:hypothetical protein
MTKAIYMADLDVLYAYLRAQTPRTVAQCPFIVGGTSTLVDASATNARATAIRGAQVDYPFATAGVWHGGAAIDCTRLDNYHYNAAGYILISKRDAQTYLYTRGLVSYSGRGPYITRAYRTFGSADIYIEVGGLDGARLMETDGTFDGGSLTGFEVSSNAFGANLTISSTAIIGTNLVRLRLSTAPANSAALVVRYLDGTNPTTTNLVRSSFLPQGSSLGLPVLPHESMTVQLIDPRRAISSVVSNVISSPTTFNLRYQLSKRRR